MIIHKITIIKNLLGLSILSSSLSAATITYDFEDGTTQGWTNITTPTTGSTSFANLPGANTFNTLGGFAIGPDLFANRDASSDQALLFRSDLFDFDESLTLSITFSLTGGNQGPLLLTSDTQVTGHGATTGGDTTGFQGIALRRESDGAYLLTQGKANNGNAFETFTFSNIDITNAILGDVASETYTLDLIDTASGGWGWIGLDNVTIDGVTVVPEPSSIALLALGSIALVTRRKR